MEHIGMSTYKLGLAAAAIAGLGLAICSAQAAPATQPGAARTEGGSTLVDKIASRRCWWRNGVRRCRWVRTYGYRPTYRGRGYDGPHYPEAYRTGSQRWWQEMDRQDRGGRGGFR
jgi:hypothetical protein